MWMSPKRNRNMYLKKEQRYIRKDIECIVEEVFVIRLNDNSF